jgi:hypothetical protein
VRGERCRCALRGDSEPFTCIVCDLMQNHTGLHFDDGLRMWWAGWDERERRRGDDC